MNTSIFDTRMLQDAVDAAHQAGGGTVTVPPGRHEMGTLVLRSRVTLRLEPGAVIVGSSRLQDYRSDVSLFVCGSGQERGRALIYAEDAEDLAIEGMGVIDGCGDAFRKDDPLWGQRPFLCRFLRCRRLRLRDVTLRNAAAWSAQFSICEDVSISGLTIHAHANNNNDGLDLDSCRRVRVSGCDLDTEDDAICLKATHGAPCEDITITGCTIRSQCGAIKLGTESYGDMRNIVIGQCSIRDTPGAPIKLLCVDGGIMENIILSDLVVRGSTGPVFIRLGDRGRTYHAGDAIKPAGRLRRVIISNLIHTAPEGGTPRHHGISLSGLPGAMIEDVTLSRCCVEVPGGIPLDQVAAEIPEKPDSFPDIAMFGVRPAHAVWARHVKGLILDDVRVTPLLQDARPRFVFEDVHDLRMSPETENL